MRAPECRVDRLFRRSDEKWGERPFMLVTLKPEFKERIGEEDLKAHMRRMADAGKLPKYGVPDRYTIVDAIPKTSVGKLDKKVMRREYR